MIPNGLAIIASQKYLELLQHINFKKLIKHTLNFSLKPSDISARPDTVFLLFNETHRSVGPKSVTLFERNICTICRYNSLGILPIFRPSSIFFYLHAPRGKKYNEIKFSRFLAILAVFLAVFQSAKSTRAENCRPSVRTRISINVFF